MFGAILAFIVVKLLVITRPIPVPRLADVSFDVKIWTFGLAITLIAVAIFTALPALRLARTSFRPLLSRTTSAL